MKEEATSANAAGGGDGRVAVRPKRRGHRALRLALRVLGGIGRWGVRVVLVLLLLLAAVFAYLHHVGIPAALTDVLLEQAAAEGYFLQVKRFRLEIDRGVVAEGVKMYAREESPEPFLEAEELSVAADPGALWRARRFTPVMSVSGGRLRARPGDGTEGTGARSGDGEVQINGINLRFTANANELLLKAFEAEFLGIRFSGRGALYFAPEEARKTGEEAGPRVNPLARALDALDELPEVVREIVEELNELTFRKPPTAEFAFTVYMAHPESNRASFRLRAGAGGTASGAEFDGYELAVDWEEGMLRVPSLQIRKGGGRASASGWFDTREGTVRAWVENTLTPADILEGCPPDVREMVAANVEDPNFPLRVEWETGPVPAERALEEFKAKVELSGATVRGVRVEKAQAEVERKDGEWLLPSAKLQLGEAGDWATRVAVSNGYFREADKRFEVQWSGAVNPHHVRPALPTNYQEYVDWFGFNEPVAIEGGVTGGTVGDPAVYCYGYGKATNFTVRGQPVQSFRTQVDITNEVMHLTGMVLQRPGEWARGDVHVAFSNQVMRMDVESTVDARATTYMVAPAVSNFFRPFRLDGPIRARISGVLDFCNFSLNRLDGHLDAQSFGYDRWVADTAVADLSMRGRRLAVSNATATLYGGKAAGSMVLYSLGSDDEWRYEVRLDSAEGIQVDKLLEASTGKPVEKLRGLLDGSGTVSGMIGAGQGPTVTGGGRAKIRNGFLMETKLFAGLSSLLGKVVPGFSAFAQTEAGGDFAIRNSRIHSEDIRLEGTVFSVKANGSFGFDNTLDYVAEVQLLRGGLVASLVRLATMPVTRLLEFRLGGTLSEPTWKPENLTLDVFKKLVGSGSGSDGDGKEGEGGTQEE